MGLRCPYKPGDVLRVTKAKWGGSIGRGATVIVAKGTHGTGKGRVCFKGRVNVLVAIRGKWGVGARKVTTRKIVIPIWEWDLKRI